MHLGQAGPDTADVEALRLQVSELQQKVEALQDENRDLKSKVSLSYFGLKINCLIGITGPTLFLPPDPKYFYFFVCKKIFIIVLRYDACT